MYIYVRLEKCTQNDKKHILGVDFVLFSNCYGYN